MDWLALKRQIEDMEYTFKYTITYELWRLEKSRLEPDRQPLFPEFRWAFQGHNLRKLQCWSCLRSHRCTRGRAQGFICVAFFTWGPERLPMEVNTDKDIEYLETVPLTPSDLSGFSHTQLFGVLYLRNFNFR